MKIQFDISENKAPFVMELLKNFSFVKNIEQAENFVLTEEYKSEVDELLARHDRGEIEFVNQEEAFKRLGL